MSLHSSPRLLSLRDGKERSIPVGRGDGGDRDAVLEHALADVDERLVQSPAIFLGGALLDGGSRWPGRPGERRIERIALENLRRACAGT